MSQKLEITIGLDREPALDSARKLRGDLRQLNEQVHADAKAMTAEETKLHQKARDERGRFLKQTADASEASYRKAGEAGRASFAMMATAAGGALQVVNQLVSQMKAYSDALDAVKRKERERGQKGASGLESMRELAALMGETPDIAFGKRMAEQRRRTLMTPEEQITFGKGVADSGAQFVGRQVSKEQDRIAREKVAALAVARGINPDAAGQLLGRIYGSRDWTGRPAEDIVAEFNASAGQLSAGSGDASRLATETSKVMAALSSDDTMRGRIRGPAAAARMVSLMAESNPGEEATAVRALSRGLFDFTDKRAVPVLKEAGIQQTDDMEAALRKIAPVIEGRARQRGVPLQTIVGESFSDEQVRTALVGAMGGVKAGVLDQRRGVEAEARRAGAAERVLSDFRGSDLGTIRRQATNEEVDESLRGLNRVRLEVLEQRARTRIKTQIERPGMQVADTLIKTFTGIDAEQTAVDREMLRDLLSGAPKGIQDQYRDASIPNNPAMRRQFFGKVMGDIEGAGGNPLAAGDPVLEEMKKQTAALERMAPGQAPPRPMAEAPPVPRR
ncbi:MAG: hypothetical protein K2X91_16805 [Thermoleophilia bacterium]|nr:hypothetical protein [Thermoleophilia bacterium]